MTSSGSSAPTAAPSASQAPQGISYLSKPVCRRFKRLDANILTRDVVLDINAQNSLPNALHGLLSELIDEDLGITAANFTRMWKTLTLKRVQDVYDFEKHQRAGHFVRLNRNTPIPAPLADLLYSIGQWQSPGLGTYFDTIPPPQAANPEPWWTVESALLTSWATMCSRIRGYYMMREFPSPSDCGARPLALTFIGDNDQGLRSVRAFTDEPLPTDCYVRFVNDELYQPVRDEMSFDACGYEIVSHTHLANVRLDYLDGYVSQRM